MTADNSSQVVRARKKRPQLSDQHTPAMTLLCPSDDVLRDTLRGFDQATHSTELLSHLSMCRHCQDRIAEWNQRPQYDSLVLRARDLDIEVRTPVPDELKPEPLSTVKAGNPEQVTKHNDGPVLGRIGNYELLELIGRGGSALVYRARHINLGRYDAVKLPLEQYSGSQMARLRFIREMNSIGQLDHPYVVRAYDAGEWDNRPYLAMELILGENVDTFSRRIGPLPVPHACEIVRQAAVGLQHIHENGLVHRDLKPSNLLISRSGIKIADLGLALLAHDEIGEDRLTGHRTILGTADYMAPEQAEGSHNVDIRADLYSLGCTLFRLLVGQAPYGGPENDTPFKKMLAHTSLPFPDLRALRSDLPDNLVTIVNKLTAKDRNQRYARPIELATALEPFCGNVDLRELGIVAPVQPVSKKSDTVIVRPDSTGSSTTTVLNNSDASATRPLKLFDWRIVVGSAALVLLLVYSARERWMAPADNQARPQPISSVPAEDKVGTVPPDPIREPNVLAPPPMSPIEARWRKQFPELRLDLWFPERKDRGAECRFSEGLKALTLESESAPRLCQLGTISEEDDVFLSVDIQAKAIGCYGFFFGLQVFDGDRPSETRFHQINVYLPVRDDGTFFINRCNAKMDQRTGLVSTTDTDVHRQLLTGSKDSLNLKVHLKSREIPSIYINEEESLSRRRDIFPDEPFTGVYGLMIERGVVSYRDPKLTRSD